VYTSVSDSRTEGRLMPHPKPPGRTHTVVLTFLAALAAGVAATCHDPAGPPPTTSTPGTVFELCYEVSVLRFGDSNIFDSPNFHTVNTGNEAGWARIDFGIEDKFGPVHQLDALNGFLIGLPVTGFWASKYVNGFAFGPGVISNYGGLFDHKGSTSGDAEVN